MVATTTSSAPATSRTRCSDAPIVNRAPSRAPGTIPSPVLPGVTRGFLIESAAERDIPVERRMLEMIEAKIAEMQASPPAVTELGETVH